MSELYSIKLEDLVRKFSLKELVFCEADRDRLIYRKEVNRPGLFLAGFHEYFYSDRIQILGKTEYEYLEHLSEEERNKSVRYLMERKPVCVILTHASEALPISPPPFLAT